jgi:hypothetical protein
MLLLILRLRSAQGSGALKLTLVQKEKEGAHWFRPKNN